MSPTVVDRVIELLKEHDATFHVLRHEPVYTSQQAAEIRGTTLASGAKALICKAGNDFYMFVMPADRRIDNKQVRAELATRKLRFASPEELLELTGLAPGSIPPFGSLFSLPTWCDDALAQQPTINFNAGDHAVSVSLAFEDYVAIERPRMGRFSR